MARVLRGEIRWADLNPVRCHEQAGLSPVLVLSHDVFNERSGTVFAVALTSQPQRAGFPLTFELQSVKLPKRSWVKISQIRIPCRRSDRGKVGARLARGACVRNRGTQRDHWLRNRDPKDGGIWTHPLVKGGRRAEGARGVSSAQSLAGPAMIICPLAQLDESCDSSH